MSERLTDAELAELGKAAAWLDGVDLLKARQAASYIGARSARLIAEIIEARTAIREQRRVRIEQAAEIERLRKAIQDVIDLADVVDATSEMALTIRRAALACPACGATREEDCRGVDLAEGCQPLGVQP